MKKDHRYAMFLLPLSVLLAAAICKITHRSSYLPKLPVKYRLSVQQRRLPNRNFVLSKYSLFACACCVFCTVKSKILKDMSRIGLSWIRSYKNKMKYIDNRTGLKHSCPVYRQDVNVRILVSIAHHTFTADTFRRTNFVSSTA